ncbi:transglycosylase domain-containing protein [Malikia sp.]|uniref:penicillin-binding protein 1A n=1 Tax=Malikia sp. TaxID=2070706 RepID=UPI00260F29C3|nr:transglycosylase domain-containing protein [Malikia sp.]MDD2727986.1 transglycosylase domain-containing protein [Malikia sp.]
MKLPPALLHRCHRLHGWLAPAIAQARLTLVRRPDRPRRLGWRGALLAIAALPALLLLYALLLIPFTPAISDIRKAATERPAQVMSADSRLLVEFKRSNRVWIELKDVAPHVLDALVATEDHRFYEHFGMDWRRTASSALHTFGGDRQGGSTLTQQLARNLYPEEIGRAPTLTRKLKEAITAFKIEAVYSKDEILETYLNTVPFLYNAYGIEMAARTYFDRSAGELDRLQAATLVGMLKGNSYYNPVLNPERALQRRNTVLAQMVKRGKLDAAKYAALKERPLRLEFERQSEPLGAAPHFSQQLRRWLISWADRRGYNLYADGLVVRTTLDSRLQAAANQAVARQGARLQGVADAAWGRTWNAKDPVVRALLIESPEYRAARDTGLDEAQALKQLQTDRAFMQRLRAQKTRVQAGLLALDPRDGHVLAWVGSRGYEQDAYDHVQQARRQPGSTFKPFVYGEALRQGLSPDDKWVDRAVEIDVGHGEIWRPSDGGPPSGRSMSLREALAQSKNTITAQLVQEVGPAKVAKLARAMGVRQSPLKEVPSLALGTSPVTLKEMVTAYGTIANGGGYLEPVFVTRIENREGRVLEEFAPAKPETVLARHQAWALYDLMRGVVDRGTGRAIRGQYGIRADVAGKTGTTQDYADGWFILMHPQLVTGAWVGFNDSRITLRSEHWGQGAHSALPMVGELTSRALRARIADPRARFEEPDDSNWLTRLWRGAGDWVQGWWQGMWKELGQRWDELLRPERAARPPAAPLPQDEVPVRDAVPDLVEPELTPPPAPTPVDPLQEKIDQIINEEQTRPAATPVTTPEIAPAQSAAP